jgi:hypothetical protein
MNIPLPSQAYPDSAGPSQQRNQACHDLEAFVSGCWILRELPTQRVRHLVVSLGAWQDIASIHQVYITTLGAAVVCRVLSLSLSICSALAA